MKKVSPIMGSLYFLEFHSAYRIKQIANAAAMIKNHCGTPPKLILTPQSKIYNNNGCLSRKYGLLWFFSPQKI